MGVGGFSVKKKAGSPPPVHGIRMPPDSQVGIHHHHHHQAEFFRQIKKWNFLPRVDTKSFVNAFREKY